MFNSSQHSATESDDFRDLEWSAFRYVADEMSAEECAAFEDLLGESEAAREAVVRNVQIAHALVSLPQQTPALAAASADPANVDTTNSDLSVRARSRGRWASSATILLVTAFCAVAAIGLRIVNQPSEPAPPGNGIADNTSNASSKSAAADAGSELLISAWLNSSAEDAASRESQSAVRETLEEPVAQAGIMGDSPVEDDGKFDWIVAAIDPEATDQRNPRNTEQ